MEFIQNLTQFDQLIVTELAHLSHKMEIGNRKTDSNWENRFYSQLFRNVGLRVNMIYSKKKNKQTPFDFSRFSGRKKQKRRNDNNRNLFRRCEQFHSFP